MVTVHEPLLYGLPKHNILKLFFFCEELQGYGFIHTSLSLSDTSALLRDMVTIPEFMAIQVLLAF